MNARDVKDLTPKTYHADTPITEEILQRHKLWPESMRQELIAQCRTFERQLTGRAQALKFAEKLKDIPEPPARPLSVPMQNALRNRERMTFKERDKFDIRQAAAHSAALNELSDNDVDLLFESLENEPWMAEPVDAADLKPAANHGMPVRSRLWGPICKLLERRP